MEKTENIKEKISNLKENIKRCKKEIEVEQEFCLHKETELKMVEVENSKEPRIVCCSCDKKLRYPTDQELKDHGYK